MTEPEYNRPGSSAAYYHAPSSPRPSVGSRESRSSLRRDRELQEALTHGRPLSSAAHSYPQSPQPHPAVLDEQHPRSSPPPQPHPPAEPSFSPLFALISSSKPPSQLPTAGQPPVLPARQTTIHHPTVHYIFADDDPEILTAALAQHHHEADDGLVSQAGSINPADRAVLLDMVPAAGGAGGLEVAWASSLSPDWAVESASVSQMGDDGDSGSTDGHNGTGVQVLTIKGVSRDLSSAPGAGLKPGKTPTPDDGELQSSGGSGPRPQRLPPAEEYNGLLQDFDKRMGILRRVVEAGAERQHKLAAAGGEVENAAGPLGPAGENDGRD
ncbi:hypothetical protein B0T22DRAFT_191591 [Podospora appendiculata]|uniref:Uncharacterized protein n=1 Tax=Podospora appendiculata TaxID=314037 RepID=A0AAE0XD60_9PEZI|nr:hypothetical protein B0T22DRAFT_191591 [Podospora appendiculata]